MRRDSELARHAVLLCADGAIRWAECLETLRCLGMAAVPLGELLEPAQRGEAMPTGARGEHDE